MIQAKCASNPNSTVDLSIFNKRQETHETSIDIPAGVGESLTLPEQVEIYYGPTCPRHVSSPSATGPFLPADDLAHPEVQIDMNAPRLKIELINNYCTFQTLSVTLIRRETFLSHRDLGFRSQHYSKFLENSLLACSARLSTSAAVRALGPSYAKCAKSDIVSELENPNMATLQGMLLLSDYEMTEARERVGWLYCGKLLYLPC